MPLQIKNIRDTEYLYWKIGTNRFSLGKKDEVLQIIRIALSRTGRDIGVVRKLSNAIGRTNLGDFLLQAPKLIRQELLTLGIE